MCSISAGDVSWLVRTLNRVLGEGYIYWIEIDKLCVVYVYRLNLNVSMM